MPSPPDVRPDQAPDEHGHPEQQQVAAVTVVAAPDRAPDPRPRRTEPTAPSPRQVTARQIRESSLMLAGRLLSLVVTLLTQVLTVRALSKSDYGAFAYALSVVLLQWIVPLGLDRADTRFLAIYDERRDYPRLFGVLRSRPRS